MIFYKNKGVWQVVFKNKKQKTCLNKLFLNELIFYLLIYGINEFIV